MTASLGPVLPERRAESADVFLSQLNNWHSALDKKIDLVALGKFLGANKDYFTQSHTFSKEPADKCRVLRTVFREKLGGFPEKSIPLLDSRFARPYWEKMTPTEEKASLDCVEAILSPDDELALSMSALKLTEDKSSHLWKHIANKEGINEYHLKDEYDSSKTKDGSANLQGKQRQINPAIEIDEDKTKQYFDTEEADKTILPRELLERLYVNKPMSLRNAYEMYGLKLFGFIPYDYRERLMSLVFEELGFKVKTGSDGKVLFVPDVKTFLARWANLQKKNPGLADFNILTVGGIATDDSFIRAYFIYTALVSIDEEFMHDMTIHVRNLIELLVMSSVTGKNFEEYKSKVDRMHFTLYRKIFSAEHHQDQLDKNFPLSAAELVTVKKFLGEKVDGRWALPWEIDASKNLEDVSQVSTRTAFEQKELERLSLVLDKLALATAPLYGPPQRDLSIGNVNKIFEENPALPVIVDFHTLHFRGGISLPYTIDNQNGNYKLRVNPRGHNNNYEINLGKERVMSPEVLKELSIQVQQNKMK